MSYNKVYGLGMGKYGKVVFRLNLKTIAPFYLSL